MSEKKYPMLIKSNEHGFIELCSCRLTPEGQAKIIAGDTFYGRLLPYIASYDEFRLAGLQCVNCGMRYLLSSGVPKEDSNGQEKKD
jgi:hypothetical protein